MAAPPNRLGLCTACSFFDADVNPDATHAGLCRRYAPTPGIMGHAQARSAEDVNLAKFAAWPIVGDQDWCGEWVGGDPPAAGQ